MKHKVDIQSRIIWPLVLWVLCISLFMSSAAFSAPVSIVDATGKTISLEHPPRRIVVVGYAPFVPLHMLYMFPEMPELLVGYEQKVKSEELFLPLIDPNSQDKVVLDANPGPEQIAALKPDLVVTRANAPGYLVRSLAILDIPVLHLGVETPEQFLKDIETIGKILDNEKRSAEIVSFYTRRLDMIRKALSDMSARKKPNVLVLEYSNRGGTASVRVPASSWIQTLQVQTAGGCPVWLDQLRVQDGWQIVGFEQIARWNPDKIFMIVWYRLNGPDVIHSLKTDAKWRLLKAVSSKELYLFPEDIYSWDSPDPRWILGVLWMSKCLYPELFGHIDMREEIYRFFDQCFGIEKEIVDMNIMPKVNLDDGKQPQ